MRYVPIHSHTLNAICLPLNYGNISVTISPMANIYTHCKCICSTCWLSFSSFSFFFWCFYFLLLLLFSSSVVTDLILFIDVCSECYSQAY